MTTERDVARGEEWSDGGDAVVDEPSPEFLVALVGEEEDAEAVRAANGEVLARYVPDSCQVEATTAVVPRWREQVVLEHELLAVHARTFSLLEERTEVQDAWRRWSECMREADFDIATPPDALFSVWPVEGPSDRELAVATADAICKQRDGVLEDWSAEAVRVQTVLLSALPDHLQARNEIQEEAVRTAERVLAQQRVPEALGEER